MLQTTANTRGWVCLSRLRLELGFFFFFFSFTISAPPISHACLRLRPAHYQIGWCLFLNEFKLGFALEFRRSVAAACLSGEALMCMLDSGCWGNSRKGSGCGGGGGVHSDTRLSLALGLLERTPRLETQLDSKLSSLGSAGLERLGDPGDSWTRGLLKRGH